MLSSRQRPDPLDAVLDIARDLTSSLRSHNRYGRLLAAICRVVPCDAACLLRLEGEHLVPLAGRGLSRAALRQRYSRGEHPRLDALASSIEPIRFPPDSPLPDPFDGLVAGAPHALEKVHDCMGCALVEKEDVVGVLTLDAFEAGTFDTVDRKLLSTLAALAGASLRTIALLDALEEKAEQKSGVAREIGRPMSSPLVGSGPEISKLRQEVEIVAPSDLHLLITGETGVGKELVARLVHESSRRAPEPLVQVNCAALPESLAESELFGHAPGAFTGAGKGRIGKFQAAEGGTLFLDEIGELSLPIQAKLLRALQSGEIQKVGSDHPLQVNVRVVAATNRQLLNEVEAGRFRADLYHRLAAFHVHVPTLGQRREDIPELLEFFAERARRQLGTGPITATKAATDWLKTRDFPGNVRELEHAITRAALRAAHKHEPGSALTLRKEHFDEAAQSSPAPADTKAARTPDVPLRERVRQFQTKEVVSALDASQGSLAEAARALGMHRSNLHHLIDRLEIDLSRWRSS